MKNKLKHKPILYTAVILAILFVILIVSAIGMFYYAFSIPEPEGLSLASWPHTFTDNFSTWIEEKDGNIGVEQIGAERLTNTACGCKSLTKTDRKYMHTTNRKTTRTVTV